MMLNRRMRDDGGLEAEAQRYATTFPSLREVLGDADVLVLGDKHHDSSSWYLLLSQLEELTSAGVTRAVVELPPDTPHLQAFRGSPPPSPAMMREALSLHLNGQPLLDLIVAGSAIGLPVHGGDPPGTQRAASLMAAVGSGPPLKLTPAMFRDELIEKGRELTRAGGSHAVPRIDEANRAMASAATEAVTEGGRAIVVMGSAHLLEYFGTPVQHFVSAAGYTAAAAVPAGGVDGGVDMQLSSLIARRMAAAEKAGVADRTFLWPATGSDEPALLCFPLHRVPNDRFFAATTTLGKQYPRWARERVLPFATSADPAERSLYAVYLRTRGKFAESACALRGGGGPGGSDASPGCRPHAAAGR